MFFTREQVPSFLSKKKKKLEILRSTKLFNIQSHPTSCSTHLRAFKGMPWPVHARINIFYQPNFLPRKCFLGRKHQGWETQGNQTNDNHHHSLHSLLAIHEPSDRHRATNRYAAIDHIPSGTTPNFSLDQQWVDHISSHVSLTGPSAWRTEGAPDKTILL